MYAKEDVTYELFEINPAEYYASRFVYQVDMKAEAAAKGTTGGLSYQKTDFLIDAIKRFRPEKILDLGGGSGVFAARIKHYCPGVRVYGIDMSEPCIQLAMKNQCYDEGIAHDVLSGLPYEDESFDFVFTMDFFGHVEFRHKDRVIEEVHRVTKKGGIGFHGIETAFVDYYGCNPKDVNDRVRKYVYMEGHVGVETLEEIVERFKKFEILEAYPFPLRPFLALQNVMASKFWGQDFEDAITPWLNENAKVMFENTVGYCNRYELNRLFSIFGKILTEKKLKSYNIPGLEQLVHGGGFSFLLTRKAA